MKRLLIALCLCASTGTAQVVDKSPHKSGFIEHDGIRLHYLDWGGPPDDAVLLLPGPSFNAHIYDDFANTLKDLFHVIALTPRSQGESSTLDALTIADEAEDIHTLVDKLHTGPLNIVASGAVAGVIATKYATMYPDRVKKVIYLDGTNPAGGPMQSVDYTGKAFPLGKKSKALDNATAVEAAVNADERARRDKAIASLLKDAAQTPPNYADLRGDVMAIRSNKTMKTNYFWLDKADTSGVRQAKLHLDAMNAAGAQGLHQFRIEAKKSETKEIDAPELIFLTHEHKLGFIVRAFFRLYPTP